MADKKSLFEYAEAASLKTERNTIRIHTPKNREVIHDSVDEVGFGRSILIDEEGQVLAGKGVTEEAQKRGAKILIVDADRDTLVAVRRKDMTEFEKDRAMLYDNRASDTSRNNKAAISRLAGTHPEQRLLKGIWGEREEQKLLRAQADAQELAPGGVDDGDQFSKDATVPGVEQDSSIRTIPIFATTDTHPEFVRKVRQLGQKVFNTTTITDTVFAIINRAHSEWVEVDNPNAQDEIGSLANESNTAQDAATA